ncbi:MAG TPA: ATPase, T2SS/T4P/T4SS family [Ktedonobacteraceae bacterium]|nr:ATPase, T2SS/T4P/T4SS family [Ktedonobacteraceae bacterium]
MQSRRHMTAPPRPKIQLQDDAWLNDRGPRVQGPLQEKAEEPTILLNREDARLPGKVEATFRANDFIGYGHPLWPAMLHISELIWRDLHNTPDPINPTDPSSVEEVRKRAVALLRTELAARQVHGLTEASLLLKGIVNEVLGYGPLKPLLQDKNITEVIAIGPRHVSIQHEGRLEEVPYHFADERHMRRVIENCLFLAKPHIRQNGPVTEAYLPDGSLLIVAMPPSVINGPVVTIRKRDTKPLTLSELVAGGTLNAPMADFLRACIHARLNIVICGNVGTGKTTLLNALCACIPEHERIVTIEEVSELHLKQKYVIQLVVNLSQTPGIDTACNLVMHARHLRPDRMIVGECRGNEAGELLRAMYSGYQGAMTTMYAQHMQDCLTRLELLCIAGGMSVPTGLLRSEIAAALDMIVYLSRRADGTYKISNITEVRGVENSGNIKLQSIFHYQDRGVDEENGQVKGTYEPTGICPSFLSKLEAMGVQLSREIFLSNASGTLSKNRS